MKKIIFYYMIMENGKVFQGNKLTVWDTARLSKHLTTQFQKKERCAVRKSLVSVKPITSELLQWELGV